jgi:hypothetical protein
LVLTIILGLSI